MLEGGAARDVEDEEGAAGAAEIGARDGGVGFLARGVPEGELHAFLPPRGIVGRGGGVGGGGVRGRGGGGADGDDARAEFHADGYVVVGGEAAFAEADRQGGFACRGVADADEFGDVIPRLGHGWDWGGGGGRILWFLRAGWGCTRHENFGFVRWCDGLDI